MKMRLVTFLWLFSVSGIVVFAQMMEPGPEIKELDFFAGEWVLEGEVQESPMGPAGTFRMEEECEWFQGEWALVCRSQGTSPVGEIQALAIMSYDHSNGVYTYYGVENTSPPVYSTGTLHDDTWIYEDVMTAGGQEIKTRVTVKETSVNSYEFVFEIDSGTGSWQTLMNSTATRRP